MLSCFSSWFLVIYQIIKDIPSLPKLEKKGKGSQSQRFIVLSVLLSGLIHLAHRLQLLFLSGFCETDITFVIHINVSGIAFAEVSRQNRLGKVIF